MAEKRMFSKTIIDSDSFLDMPVTARLLYYDLSMRADDDGFVNSPKKIMRIVGASQDDLSILCAKKFLIPFESGVVVIKHWKIHNYIRMDTYKETTYLDEKSMLSIDENKAYKLSISDCRGRAVDDSVTQIRIDKIREDKIREDNIYIVEHSATAYTEIVDYLNQKTGNSFKPTSKKTKDLIKSRIKDGFTENDFYTVIDNMSAKWGNDSKMCDYLRPETLFGTKFESYLNVKPSRTQADLFAEYANSLEGGLD